METYVTLMITIGHWTKLLLIKFWNTTLTIITTPLYLQLSCRRSLVPLGGYIVNSLDYYSCRLIGKLTAFLKLQEFSRSIYQWRTLHFQACGLPITAQSKSRQHPRQGGSSPCQFKYRRRTHHITTTYSPISLTDVVFINFVSIFRCSSSVHNRVHASRVDSSTLVSSYLVFHHTEIHI